MSNLSEITVAILAGGFGTRIQFKVLGKPKVLATINNHTFLEYLFDQLNHANFKKIILCTGYLSDHIEKTFGTRYKNLNLSYSTEQVPLGTAGSLRKAFPLLRSDIVLVMNGDSFCNVDFNKFLQFHIIKKAEVSIVLSKVLDTSLFGEVILGKDENITGFNEKNSIHKIGLVNAGIYLINKSIIKKIPVDKKISLEKDIFPTLIEKRFYGYKVNDNFIDIGTPESYVQAEKFFAKYNL